MMMDVSVWVGPNWEEGRCKIVEAKKGEKSCVGKNSQPFFRGRGHGFALFLLPFLNNSLAPFIPSFTHFPLFEKGN
jgi:hypothetical protein